MLPDAVERKDIVAEGSPIGFVACVGKDMVFYSNRHFISPAVGGIGLGDCSIVLYHYAMDIDANHILRGFDRHGDGPVSGGGGLAQAHPEGLGGEGALREGACAEIAYAVVVLIGAGGVVDADVAADGADSVVGLVAVGHALLGVGKCWDAHAVLGVLAADGANHVAAVANGGAGGGSGIAENCRMGHLGDGCAVSDEIAAVGAVGVAGIAGGGAGGRPDAPDDLVVGSRGNRRAGAQHLAAFRAADIAGIAHLGAGRGSGVADDLGMGERGDGRAISKQLAAVGAVDVAGVAGVAAGGSPGAADDLGVAERGDGGTVGKKRTAVGAIGIAGVAGGRAGSGYGIADDLSMGEHGDGSAVLEQLAAVGAVGIAGVAGGGAGGRTGIPDDLGVVELGDDGAVGEQLTADRAERIAGVAGICGGSGYGIADDLGMGKRGNAHADVGVRAADRADHIAGVAGGRAGRGSGIAVNIGVGEHGNFRSGAKKLAAVGAVGVAGIAGRRAGSSAVIADNLPVGVSGLFRLVGNIRNVGFIGFVGNIRLPGLFGLIEGVDAVGTAAIGGDVQLGIVVGEGDGLQCLKEVAAIECKLAVLRHIKLAIDAGGVHGAIGRECAVVNAVRLGINQTCGVVFNFVHTAAVVHGGVNIAGHPLIPIVGDSAEEKPLRLIVGEGAANDHVTQIHLRGGAGGHIVGVKLGGCDAVDSVKRGEAVDRIAHNFHILPPDAAVGGGHLAADGGEGAAAVMAEVEAVVAGGHGDGEVVPIVHNAHPHRHRVGRQAGAVGGIPVDAAVIGHGKAALIVGGEHIGGGVLRAAVSGAPDAVYQTLRVPVKVNIIAVVQHGAAVSLVKPPGAAAVVAELHPHIRGGNDDMLGIEGILTNRMGVLNVKAGGCVEYAVGTFVTVQGAHIVILRAAVYKLIDRLEVSHDDSVVIVGVGVDVENIAVEMVRPAQRMIEAQGASVLVDGVINPLKIRAVVGEDAVELVIQTGAVRFKDEIDVVRIVAHDLLEPPLEIVGLIPGEGIGQGVPVVQVSVGGKIGGIEDSGAVAQLLENIVFAADFGERVERPCTGVKCLRGSRGGVDPVERLPVGEEDAGGVGHDAVSGAGRLKIFLLRIKLGEAAAVKVAAQNLELIAPILRGEIHLLIVHRDAANKTVAIALRSEQLLSGAHAADGVDNILGINQLQSFAPVMAGIQAVIAGKKGAVGGEAGGADGTAGLGAIPAGASVIGAVEAAHVAGGDVVGAVCGVDEGEQKGAAAADSHDFCLCADVRGFHGEGRQAQHDHQYERKKDGCTFLQ